MAHPTDEKRAQESYTTPSTQPSINIATTEDYSTEGLAPQDGLGSAEPHIFSDPARAAYWRELYEKSKYEGRARFDPALTWTAETERRLKMKVIPFSLCA
jgi:hypothetical protein